MLSLDELIGRALQFDVPELRMPELPERASESSAGSKIVSLPLRRFSTPVWLGIAASLAVVAVLGIRALTNQVVYPSLSAEILAHLDHEPGALKVTAEAVSDRRLDKALDGRAEINSSAGLITYARTCVIDGHRVPHLVIQGEHGPVTVLLLADEMIDAPITIEGVGIRGVILPVGSGSIAVIGERDEALEQIEKRVIDSMQWTT
jgi:hypothetical protein